MPNNNELMDKIVSLCKRRGFVFPGSEIYGGLANSWDYGPLGVELKNNIKQLWWKRFVQQRDDVVGLDAALIMNPKVWEASGHVGKFTDYSIECAECHIRQRVDHQMDERLFKQMVTDRLSDLGSMEVGKAVSIITQVATDAQEYFNDKIACPNCGKKNWYDAKESNLLITTYLGTSVKDRDKEYYFRPETAQAMFVDFKNVADTSRKKLPFGIAQQGKAFRNEITPGNFIFRTREFEQMEIEYFFHPTDDWNKHFNHWHQAMISWIENDLGLDLAHVHELEVPKEDLAHYSKRTIDFEYDFPFGKKELYGLAYRTNFDLANHYKEAAPYYDSETNEKLWPHCIEPTWGVDRTILAVLSEHYREDGDGDKKRVWLHLPPKLAPYKLAVFPLLKNKPELVEKARGIYNQLKERYMVAWDDRGNVGKRYYSQDEIGTPFCVTVDFDTLEKGTVTVRNRDTAEQETIALEDLAGYISVKIGI